MPRKRFNHYAKGPQAEDAAYLAKKIFNLKAHLGINLERMAEETDLSVNTLRYIKYVWVNGNKEPEYMYVSIANALVDFWNRHLTNGQGKSKTVKAYPPKKSGGGGQKKKQKVDQHSEIDEDVISILIEKVGIAKARELLSYRGKEDKLIEFLESLTPDELADLV